MQPPLWFWYPWHGRGARVVRMCRWYAAGEAQGVAGRTAHVIGSDCVRW